jgi:hypothetical protein
VEQQQPSGLLHPTSVVASKISRLTVGCEKAKARVSSSMYASWFSYNITRPYPYRWFTPVAIIGGVVLTVLVSLVNLGSSGYYLKTIYTNDPNTTIASSQKYGNGRSFSGKQEEEGDG